ncbi:MAG: cation:proton antiporter [Chlorobi bacterium]|nr:cation:proton antiporter [Chlorobiota bacterium]
MEYIGLITGFILVILGIWGFLTQKNILKMIIGFTISDTGINVIIVSISYLKNRTAPILNRPDLLTDTVNKITDPVPQALVLTAIVIGVGVTALMLSYALRLYQEKNTLDINNFKDLKW